MRHRRNRSISERGCAAVLGILASASLCNAQACGRPGPDLVMGSVTDVGNHTATGGFDAISLGAVLCNNGTVTIPTNFCPSANHPLMAGNLYRFSTVSDPGGATYNRMEQIGMSWVKTNYVPANSSTLCTCQGGAGGNINPGCSDTYFSGFQSGASQLGPRFIVNAFTGSMPAICPPHPSGGNFGRLEFALGDAAPTAGGPGATLRYFGEQAVLSPGDATFTDASNPQPVNGHNNTSNIELSVAGGPAEFTFALVGAPSTTQVGVSAVQRWRQIDAAVTESAVVVPAPPSQPNATEGRFIVCSRATPLGGGRWHYEFAVNNMNSDRSAGTFAVPVADGVTLSNIEFHGVTYRGGDGNAGFNVSPAPWTATRSGGMLTWATSTYDQGVNGNAIRWGTTYNFRFDADIAPALPPAAGATVTVGLWKPGASPDAPSFISAPAQVPSAPFNCAPTDIDLDGHATPADIAGFVNRWFTSLQDGTLAGDFDANGSVNPADVAAFVSAWFAALGNGC